MQVHIQRVKEASVTIGGTVKGRIEKGLLLLVAAEKEDTGSPEALAEKCLKLRIFPDENGKMNRSVQDVNGGLLVISNFTLYGDCRKGNRPNFMRAAPANEAEKLYDRFVATVRKSGQETQTGEFGAMMDVQLINDGPVTVIVKNG